MTRSKKAYNFYFVSKAIEAKGLSDFDYLAYKLKDSARFYWFAWTVSESVRNSHKHINFEVGLDDKTLKSRINEMDALVCVSKFEGFSIPIAEALLNNKKCFSYDLPELVEVYKDTVTYVNSFKKDEYADLLSKEIDSGLPNTNAESNKEFIVNNYSSDAVVKKIYGILQQNYS